MQIIRFQFANEAPAWGWVNANMVGLISGSPFGEYRRQSTSIPMEKVRLLAPAIPSKILGVGRNFAAHANEQNVEIPEIPLIFLKPPSAIIGPLDKIELPPQSQQVEHEAELAVVMGKTGRWISAEQAEDYILGYTIGLDITARDLQRRDGQWTRGKGFDTFCPLGPWIETELDPSDAIISCRVNGELRQMASTREMIFTIPQLVAYISSAMTLEAGDVILTGTPSGIGKLAAGDIVLAEIEGIGTLRNEVVACPMPK